jgi:hypothetical protein
MFDGAGSRIDHPPSSQIYNWLPSVPRTSPPAFACAELIFCEEPIAIHIHPLEFLLGISNIVKNSQKLPLGDLSVLVGIQFIKSLLASKLWSTLSALALTATLGKPHPNNQEDGDQSKRTGTFQDLHDLPLSCRLEQHLITSWFQCLSLASLEVGGHPVHRQHQSVNAFDDCSVTVQQRAPELCLP